MRRSAPDLHGNFNTGAQPIDDRHQPVDRKASQICIPNADLKQFKALLAAEIIKAIDRLRLSVRQAQSLTGIAAADFSRIRNADLGRFTVDRLMSIINRLGSRVEVAVKVRRSPSHVQQAAMN